MMKPVADTIGGGQEAVAPGGGTIPKHTYISGIDL